MIVFEETTRSGRINVSDLPWMIQDAAFRALWPVLTKTSSQPIQATMVAALPAHAVIQHGQALTNPANLPKASRAQKYGPPLAGPCLC
ncbi:hypothetical protein [Streptomyces siamensis]|uniref:hypothetical protein n=1 Tax=Streptomyces siamensis TaxID=1274986 RepID=UPI003CD0AAC0